MTVVVSNQTILARSIQALNARELVTSVENHRKADTVLMPRQAILGSQIADTQTFIESTAKQAILSDFRTILLDASPTLDVQLQFTEGLQTILSRTSPYFDTTLEITKSLSARDATDSIMKMMPKSDPISFGSCSSLLGLQSSGGPACSHVNASILTTDKSNIKELVKQFGCNPDHPVWSKCELKFRDNASHRNFVYFLREILDTGSGLSDLKKSTQKILRAMEKNYDQEKSGDSSLVKTIVAASPSIGTVSWHNLRFNHIRMQLLAKAGNQRTEKSRTATAVLKELYKIEGFVNDLEQGKLLYDTQGRKFVKATPDIMRSNPNLIKINIQNKLDCALALAGKSQKISNALLSDRRVLDSPSLNLDTDQIGDALRHLKIKIAGSSQSKTLLSKFKQIFRI